ncbi:MAG: HdeD family acid-resistance protein [Acetobacteraceae bacterium]
MSDQPIVASKWGWFLLLGVISILAGVFAIAHPLLVTLASVIFIGAALLVGGIFQIIQSFMTKGWSGFAWGIVGGLLSVIGGVLIMQEPAAGSVVITLFLLAVLVVSGITRIVIAFQHRNLPMWWLLALGGLVSVVVGVMLYATMPWSSLWVLGTLIGVELIFEGVGWTSFSLDLRRGHRAG